MSVGVNVCLQQDIFTVLYMSEMELWEGSEGTAFRRDVLCMRKTPYFGIWKHLMESFDADIASLRLRAARSEKKGSYMLGTTEHST